MIRIPSGGLQAGSIQQIQVGNKVQYVRVVGSAGATQQVKAATASATSAASSSSSSSTSIPTAIPLHSLQSLKNVKIAIPPAKPSAQAKPHQRIILPQGQQLKAIPIISNEKGVSDLNTS